MWNTGIIRQLFDKIRNFEPSMLRAHLAVNLNERTFLSFRKFGKCFIHILAKKSIKWGKIYGILILPCLEFI